MATITVRIPDETRDALQGRADAAHETLSDFVRNCLQDAVIESPERAERRWSRRIESLTLVERQTLALLHRILARVLPEDANDEDGDESYQLSRASVLEQGFTGEYSTEFEVLSGELSIAQCGFVVDVLSMFQLAKWSMEDLGGKGEGLPEDQVHALTFRGFDFNDPLEGHMGAYVRHLVTEDRWAEQMEVVHNGERGNSHLPMREAYSRMLAEYRDLKQRQPKHQPRLLTKRELEQLAAARIHPDNR